jgi:hypothetical protein
MRRYFVQNVTNHAVACAESQIMPVLVTALMQL